jgi:hypothetical protein
MAHFCLKCGLQIFAGDRGNITIKADGFEHKQCAIAMAKQIKFNKPIKPIKKEEIKVEPQQPSVMEKEEKKEEKKDSYPLKQTTDWIDGIEEDNGVESESAVEEPKEE